MNKSVDIYSWTFLGSLLIQNIKINNAKLLGDKDVNSSNDVGVKFVVKQK